MPVRRAYLNIALSDDDELWASVVDAPVKVGTRVRRLVLAAPGALDTAADLLDHGANIRTALMGHPEIRTVLESLDVAPYRETWNVLFGLSSPTGEAIRWEALHDAEKQHLSTRAGKRIFRVAADPASPELPIHELPVPMRVAAFLSPAGVDPTDEFQALVETVAQARADGLDIELSVFVARRDLLGRPFEAGSGISVDVMPNSNLALQDKIAVLKPHVIHFFCHGLSQTPQSLQFATVSDDRIGKAEGSVVFSIERLLESSGLEKAWTVVFNCCDGGKPTAALNSMAFRTVAEGGVPAAVGMGAPLPAGAAPIFTRAFYTTLFSTLREATERTADGAVEIDFGGAIMEGRRVLHEAIPGGVPEICWALPIIYLHRRSFFVQRLPAIAGTRAPGTEGDSAPAQGPPATAPDARAMEERVRTVAGFLRAMPASMPLAARQAALALFDLDPQVPVELRCDTDGNFPVRRMA